MSSIVCLKLSYRVLREDLSVWVSPLNSDPAVATREGLEYTCKNIKNNNQKSVKSVALKLDNNKNNYLSLQYNTIQ